MNKTQEDKRDAGVKAILAAMLANIGIAALKFVAWALTGAASMLAEAVHSVADSANQIIMLWGDKSAKKKADEAHQFGHGRNRFITAFLVALILFSMGGLFAIYEAFNKFKELQAGHPNDLLSSQWWWVAIVVLLGAIIMESLSLRVALRESKPHRQGMKIWQFVHRSKEPEFMVVILEDTAALTGLTLAFLGIVLTLLTGNAIFDVIGSGLIGLLLITVAVILAVETKSLLVGESADKETMEKIKAALSSVALFEHTIYIKTIYISPDELFIAAKVAVPKDAEADEIAAAIDSAEAKIRDSVEVAHPIYIEPDIWDPDRMTGARQKGDGSFLS
ncbi:MAG: cation diffusion facilitator family transporter [Coriobacteriales bacterium]|jgi:cation diffusion facilitator family transporter|nr:cation diffusion facilitator family transporter [Coriobacteriales bacterium]